MWRTIYNKDPFTFPILMALGATITSFIFVISHQNACEACAHQRLLWGTLLVTGLMGRFFRNKHLLWLVSGLAAWILGLSYKGLVLPSLFRTSTVIVKKTHIGEGLICKTITFLGISLHTWSFFAAASILLFCIFTVFKNSRRTRS